MISLDKWYVYLIAYAGRVVYVGKGTNERLFVSAYNSWEKLAAHGHAIEPHEVRPHFFFSDIDNENVAFGLETYTIYSYDEAGIPLLNVQRREIDVVEKVSIRQFAAGAGDYVTYHPPPYPLPKRLNIEMGLQFLTQKEKFLLNQAWLYKLAQLTEGVSVTLV